MSTIRKLLLLLLLLNNIIIKVEVIKKLADEWDDEEDGDELVK